MHFTLMTPPKIYKKKTIHIPQICKTLLFPDLSHLFFMGLLRIYQLCPLHKTAESSISVFVPSLIFPKNSQDIEG